MSNQPENKQRLLIVDDSKVIRVTARKILQDHFETVEAVDGENAWELLNNNGPFALVVSDLTMPNLDGYGLLEKIRSSHQPQIKSVPVIVITGANDSEATKSRATQVGATDFIGKPFDSVHLLARTQAHASAHATTQTLTGENIELETQALTDALTGMANETAFMDHSYQQLSYAVRHKTSLAVFRVEIDDFGDIYKLHGKDISESVIKSVAMVLQSGIRQEDMAARVGTARFALLLPGMNTTGIRNLADRLNRDISARILKQGEHKIRYTVSIGVAAPEIRRDTRFDELLSIADSRLGYATAQGGNQVVFDEPGPATQLPHDQTVTGVTVPVLQDDDITAMINRAVDDAIEYESISSRSTGTPASNDRVIPDEAATVEDLAMQKADDLPGLFAGPVPELSITASPGATQAEIRKHATAGPGTIRFDQAADDGETIIITAPFDINDPFDDSPTATQAAEETSLPDQVPATDPGGKDNPDADNNSAENALPAVTGPSRAEDTDEIIEQRPGLFRRICSTLTTLFRRSRLPD